MTPNKHQDALTRIEQSFKDVFIIEDEGIIKLLLATIIAHRHKADPVWLFIVGGSSTGKTEFITSLNDVAGIYTIGSLTSHSFLSGFKSKGSVEVNMLDRMKNGIMSFKDFTSILSTNQEARGEIMGQLREIYDGAYSRDFGTGERKTWKGKLGLIAGATTKVYTTQELYAAMGERFIMYAFKQPDQKIIGARTISNAREGMKEKRMALRATVKDYLDNFIQIPEELPELDEEYKKDLIDLAEFSTRARSPVERDWRSMNKEIVFKHDPEGIGRFLTQLVTLSGALQTMNGNITNGLTALDKGIIYKICLDSINRTRRVCLQALTKYQHVETAALALKLNYPTNTIRRFLEDLNVLEVIDRDKIKRNADVWNLKPQYRALLARFEAITPILENLTESAVLAEEAYDLRGMAESILPTAETAEPLSGEVVYEDPMTDPML